MRLALALSLLLVILPATPATAGTFGTTPVNVAVARTGGAANGPSGEPAVSGDNRSVRLVAFTSHASNLVAGDNNGVSDIFAWKRPRGYFPHKVGSGSLIRISVGRGGAPANGASSAPSVDGSMVNRPHCVGFISTATNITAKDALPDPDVYVRDLRKGRTLLLSAGTAGDASSVSLAGNCKKAVFEAGGRVWWTRIGKGRPHALGRGSQPSYSRDGKSIVYVRADGRVLYRHGGKRAVLSAGSKPRVSDYSNGHGWAVVYNAAGNVKLALINRGRKTIRTAVRHALAGGVTSRAAHRGILVWSRSSALYYLNRNTGNSDDLAYAHRAITEVASSARANLIAFTASGGRGFIDTKDNDQPSVYVKWLPK